MNQLRDESFSSSALSQSSFNALTDAYGSTVNLFKNYHEESTLIVYNKLNSFIKQWVLYPFLVRKWKFQRSSQISHVSGSFRQYVDEHGRGTPEERDDLETEAGRNGRTQEWTNGGGNLSLSFGFLDDNEQISGNVTSFLAAESIPPVTSLFLANPFM